MDVNYIGTKGTHLYFNSAGGEQYFGTWVNRKPPTRPCERLGTYVPNPYAGVINSLGCGISGPNIAAGNLLRPYPQINGLSTVNPPWANSIYNALQIKVEKHMRQGIQFMVSYTNAKSIDDASMSTSTGWIGGFGQMRDPNNRKLERSLSEWDIPQVFQFSYIWQVPYGRGKHFGSNVNSIVNGFLGGWQTSGMWRFDNGMPASIGVTGASAPWGYSTTNPDQIAKLTSTPSRCGLPTAISQRINRADRAASIYHWQCIAHGTQHTRTGNQQCDDGYLQGCPLAHPRRFEAANQSGSF